MLKQWQNDTQQPIPILIVDALSHTRESLRTFLQLHDGMDVVGEASNGAEALNLTQTLQPNIVIMDAHLPDQAGFDVTRDLRALSPPPAVILLTVHLTETDVQQAKACGAVALIEKSAGVDPIIEHLLSLKSSHI